MEHFIIREETEHRFWYIVPDGKRMLWADVDATLEDCWNVVRDYCKSHDIVAMTLTILP